MQIRRGRAGNRVPALRFAIPLVVEHYGSTEMPGDAVLNYFNVPGSCGYVPLAIWADRDAKIVAYDVAAEAVVRDQVRRATATGRERGPFVASPCGPLTTNMASLACGTLCVLLLPDRSLRRVRAGRGR